MRFFLPALLALLLSACAQVPERQQGNILDPKAVATLALGASQQQVLNTLGAPLLQHPFKPNVWIYVYQRRNDDKTYFRQHLVITFNNQGTISELPAHNTDIATPETQLE